MMNLIDFPFANQCKAVVIKKKSTLREEIIKNALPNYLSLFAASFIPEKAAWILSSIQNTETRGIPTSLRTVK